MKVFDAYSEYYDLIYSTKDYTAEAAYVDRLIKKYAPASHSILELGCGTGLHAALLAKAGYEVDGIDQSDSMLAKASARKIALPADIGKKVSFSKGDIRSYRTQKKYDVVISLFHVMSYMTTDEDLIFAFVTAAKHLKPNGLFIFDCWHGPAVLHDKPISRVKLFENDNIDVKRISYPELIPEKNVVNVKFNISIRDKNTQAETLLEELHAMRYLFPDEIIHHLQQADLKIENMQEWLTHRSLSEETWNACYVCRKKGE
jgi:SAM-dependent methyltransferase